MKLNKLKSWLALRSVSNEELAKAVGRTKGTISLYSRNEVLIPLDVAYSICVYLDIELSDLFISTGEYYKMIKTDSNGK